MRKNRKLRGKQVVISLLFLGFLLFAAWAIITSLDTSRKLSTFPTGGIGTVGTALSSPTFMLSPTGTETSTDIATDTPILSLGLEEPIGLNKIFILHNVISGESLEFIARRYGTTVESLVRCNYELPSPLLPGIVIVVPVNYVVDDEFPPFNVYEVLVKTSPEALAEKLNVNLADFMYYNDFTSGIFLYPGNWVLIPQSAKSVP